MTTLTKEDVRERLNYHADTGKFSWVSAPSRAVCAGSMAGSVHPSGHVYISLKRKLYAAHRLAWLYVYGTWPRCSIDHINGDPADNRIENLRELSHVKNLQAARKARRDNRSGLLGVTFRKDVAKWQARIQRNKQMLSLGLYASPEEAHIVYLMYKNNF